MIIRLCVALSLLTLPLPGAEGKEKSEVVYSVNKDSGSTILARFEPDFTTVLRGEEYINFTKQVRDAFGTRKPDGTELPNAEARVFVGSHGFEFYDTKLTPEEIEKRLLEFLRKRFPALEFKLPKPKTEQ